MWAVFLGHCVGVVFDVDRITHTLDIVLTLNWLFASPYQIALHDFAATLHNVILWPMVAVVGLYLIFKQRRPGMRHATGQPHGSFYGMPSGDAMFAASVVGFIFPKHRWLAALVMTSVAASRVVRGLHSILQVFFGTITGCLAAFLYRRWGAPFQIATRIFSFFSPFLTFFDRRLRGTCDPGCLDNLHAWVVQDLGVIAFDILVCPLGGFERVTGARIAVAWFLRIVFDWIGTYFIVKGMAFCLV
jgi:membrane-associated phospholipid phosphatase